MFVLHAFMCVWCVHVCVHMFVCLQGIWGREHVHVAARSQCHIFLNFSPLYLLMQGLSMKWELTDLTSLTLSLLSGTGITGGQPCLLCIYVDIGDLNSVPHTCSASPFIHGTISPIPEGFISSFSHCYEDIRDKSNLKGGVFCLLV